MERKLADSDVTEEEQTNILKYLERKETEYMRLQRHKMGVDDFELLTIIGRGAFGEVHFSPLIGGCLAFACSFCCFRINHIGTLLNRMLSEILIFLSFILNTGIKYV